MELSLKIDSIDFFKNFCNLPDSLPFLKMLHWFVVSCCFSVCLYYLIEAFIQSLQFDHLTVVDNCGARILTHRYCYSMVGLPGWGIKPQSAGEGQ